MCVDVGGTFALYSLLKRAGDFRTFGKAHPTDTTLERYSLAQTSQRTSSFQQRNQSDRIDWTTRLARNGTYQQVLHLHCNMKQHNQDRQAHAFVIEMAQLTYAHCCSEQSRIGNHMQSAVVVPCLYTCRTGYHGTCGVWCGSHHW